MTTGGFRKSEETTEETICVILNENVVVLFLCLPPSVGLLLKKWLLEPRDLKEVFACGRDKIIEGQLFVEPLFQSK